MKFSSNVEFEKYTTTARDARVAAGKMPVGSVIENTTTGTVQWRKNASTWLDIGAAPGASLIPVAYQANPTLASLRDAMVQFGGMSPQPTYVISGQVTGSIQNGITVELRDNGTNALLDSVTTNVTGNYTFAARVAGTYKVLPILNGYAFTPSAPVISLSANTTQNFVSAVDLGSAEVSPTHVLVTGSNSTVRAMKKSPRALEADAFGVLNGQAIYGQLYYNGRWFIPGYTSFRLFTMQEAGGVFTQKAAINTADPAFNVGNPYRVFVNTGGKLAILGGTSIRFGTYDNVTDTFTPGNLVNTGVFMTDAVFGNGKIYISSSFGGGPSRNLTIIDMATEIVTTQNVPAFAGSAITNIGYGSGKLLVGNGSSNAVIDAATFVQVGSTVILGTTQAGRTAFSQGRFWLAVGANLRWINASNAATGLTTFTSAPAPGALHGAVADANYVYAADNGNGRLYTINPITATEDGVSVVAIAGGAAYLKN